MFNQVARKAVMMASAVAMLAGCNKSTDSFSLLKDGADYKQQAVFIPKKIDILWVIDNSGSMKTSQDNLASNFQAFISRFNQYNYDFHMAVVTTDGWERQFNASSEKARIRDGAVLQTNPRVETHSGVFVMDKATPNLSSVFETNIKQGTLGNGDERAFESFKQSLLDPFNSNFRRADAFLAVIIVSDEEDYSGSSTAFEDASKNYPVQNYVDFLNSYTDFATNGKNYSVNVISVPDEACKTQLSTDGFARKISVRLPELADLTGGVKASLCSNFGSTLELISDSIIQLSAVFKLSREPQEDTIKVVVDGATVANDPVNGWTYNASDLTITFHGSSVPGANANIQIDYYPKSIKL
ncbi:hypothetical protein QJS83_16350 [Bdellovibrio sp. 22V]|uniref:hypothetical protein n=1 Tax=Bdellovibrio TaxID=958 RepID=UPI002542AA90|nr:hypothetical protein [Bdellovibrio sp. 22V]WII72035.1 hypothetical protein QJS83_16350 [Bdellovibrio sp. 22V]